MKERDQEILEMLWNGCIGGASIAVCAALLLVLFVFCSCKTSRSVAIVPEVRTEYVHKTDSVTIHDGIYVHDSTYVSKNGDTLYIEKHHIAYVDRWRDRWRVDTLIKSDSIPYPVPVPEYVDKELNWWQKTRMRLGELMIAVLVVLTGIGVYRLRKLFPL